MFMVEIGGMRALYTGDYSRIPDRHLPGADLPQVRPDIGSITNNFTVLVMYISSLLFAKSFNLEQPCASKLGTSFHLLCFICSLFFFTVWPIIYGMSPIRRCTLSPKCDISIFIQLNYVVGHLLLLLKRLWMPCTFLQYI